MELYQLRYMVAVAESLNFTRAAKLLHVSQSAVSRQVMLLENKLGVRVFERNRQSVSVTDEGRVVLAQIAKVLSEVSVLESTAGELAEGRGGELIVCYNPRSFFNFIPDSLAEFRSCHPQSEVRLMELRSQEQAAALHARKAHLGFIPSVFLENETELERLRVMTSDIVVVVSRSHRLASRKTVTLTELSRETWLINNDLPKAHPSFIRQYCKDAGFAPIFGRHGTGIEELLGMVAAGYGITIMPRFILAKHRSITAVRLLKTDCTPVELCAVWLKSNPSRLLQEYLAILRKHFHR